MVGEMEAQRLRELERPRKEPNRKLGEGGYGEVYEGTYRNEPVGIVQNDILIFCSTGILLRKHPVYDIKF